MSKYLTLLFLWISIGYSAIAFASDNDEGLGAWLAEKEFFDAEDELWSPDDLTLDYDQMLERTAKYLRQSLPMNFFDIGEVTDVHVTDRNMIYVINVNPESYPIVKQGLALEVWQFMDVVNICHLHMVTGYFNIVSKIVKNFMGVEDNLLAQITKYFVDRPDRLLASYEVGPRECGKFWGLSKQEKIDKVLYYWPKMLNYFDADDLPLKFDKLVHDDQEVILTYLRQDQPDMGAGAYAENTKKITEYIADHACIPFSITLLSRGVDIIVRVKSADTDGNIEELITLDHCSSDDDA